MKKIYLFIKGAKRWNNLLNKFTKLHKRIQLLLNSDNTTQYNKLVNKLQSIYSKLEKMQYQTGIKVAGTSLAIILSTFTANAQFAAGQLVQEGFTTVRVPQSSSPVFADIDGDGDLDAYIGESYGEIKVFTNNSGVFTAAGSLQAGGTTINISAQPAPTFADIDGDGDLDLYVGEINGKINVFTNNSGVFTASSDLQADGSTIDAGAESSPTFADVDGDGDLDLYISNHNGFVEVFTNDSATFTAAGKLQAGGVNIDEEYSTPTFEDIDGDGDLDLYLGVGYGTIKVFTNNGTGVFAAGTDFLVDSVTISITDRLAPTFADIDSDGDLDLYLGHNLGTIKVFTNNSGVFTAASDLQANLYFDDIDVGGYAAPTFADIDGDGDLDLYTGLSDGSINLFTNDGSGVFTAAALQADSMTISLSWASSPTFADIDSDGDLDLYAGDGGSGAIKVYTNNNSEFTVAADLQADSTDIAVSWSISPTFADIDADGDLDLYVGEYYGAIKVFTNNGSGVFTAPSDLQADTIPIDIGYYSSPTFADIDGDGDLDLYVGEYDGTIKVFTNNGSGVFAASSDLQAGGVTINVGYRSKPAFADIDGDGDLDLYVGDGYGKIEFFENTAPVTAILVSSITIQGAGNASTITTQGGTLQMSATVLPATADDATYTWSVINGTGSATIDVNGLLTATGDGTVTVTATANDGSGETATYEVTISNQSVGINDLTFQNLSVFPNPTNGIINLNVSESLSSISIMDLTGKTIKVFNSEAKQLDISEFTAGIYFLEIANTERKSIVKVVKK